MKSRRTDPALSTLDRREPGELAVPGLKNRNPPAITGHASQTQIWVGLIVLAILAVQYQLNFTGASSIALEVIVILVICVASLANNSPTGIWAPAPIFLIVLGVFHLGLAPYWILNIDPDFNRTRDYIWFSGPIGVKSLLLCGIAIVAYTVGAAFVTLLAVRSRPVARLLNRDEEQARSNNFANVGAVVLLAALLVWAGVAYGAGGLGIFVGPYQEFLALTKQSVIADTYLFMGFGLVLTLMAPIRGWRAIVIGAFLVFAFFAFFLGLRGEILFPLAAGVSVVAFRRKLPPAWAVLVGGVVVLTLVNAAKVVRQSGIAGLSSGSFTASPLTAIGELGQSIRVVATTYLWHGELQEPFRNGDTYTVAIARALEAVLSPGSRPPAAEDFRLMNSEVLTRAGGIGGSAVAEAFHNFGAVGVVVVFLLLGAVFGWFSRSNVSSTTVALYAAISLPLLNHVRNSFVPVVPVALAGIAAVLVIAMLPRLQPRRRARLNR